MKIKYFFIMLLITTMTFTFVWVRLQIVSISYSINTLTKQEQVLRERCNNLSLQINGAKSPRRLEILAKTYFKMKTPRPDQVIVLSEQ